MAIGPRDLQRALETNSTDNSFTSKIPTVTEPTGNGVFLVGAETVELLPFGSGADNSTFNMRVIGWRQAGGLWVPQILADLSCTLSQAVGIAKSYVINTERFADAITVTTGNAVVDAVTADTPVKAVVGVAGYKKVEFIFDLVTATGANCLFCQF